MKAPLIKTALALAVAAGALVVATATAGAERGRSADAGLQAVRAWTDRYQAEAAALADGYVRTDDCVPGMGYHYIDFSRLDTTLEPSRPEVILYGVSPDGHRVLLGAEWIVVDRDQDLATDEDRPAVFGHDFDGPMPGHGPGMPIHYDLHAWAWSDNPDRGFATWNPTITCP